jgi:hypothetical protein
MCYIYGLSTDLTLLKEKAFILALCEKVLILHIPTTPGPDSSYRALKARGHIPEYAFAVQR